jgi:conjugative transfer signal peptidase TraF
MKPVVARTGERVEFTARGVAVNGQLLPNTAPRDTDAMGRSLQHWPFGSYYVTLQNVWVVSTYNPRSYDSRYFGPVQIHSIGNHLLPVKIFP